MTTVIEDRFKKVEKRFDELQEERRQGRISQREFIDSLKQLRFRDDEGKFWMVGARSGQWYCFDPERNEWVPAVPPALNSHKAICIYCGYENDLEAEVCVKCGGRTGPDEDADHSVCPFCGRRLEKPGMPCPYCSSAPGEENDREKAGNGGGSPVAEAQGRGYVVIQRIDLVSAFWMSGVLGIFLGLLFGLVIGVSNFFPHFVSALPQFFIDIQGKLPGGIIYPLLGAGIGFAGLGGAGLAATFLLNLVMSLVGGFRIQVGKKPAGPSL